jgi:2-polyprenyl-6-methoxyphenol hydroxylase-like FAD-dependent oxidoreductase
VFINLETLEPKFLIPPGDRRRVNREKLRKVLLKSVSDNVNWNKRLASIEERDDGVVAMFEDGSRAEGSLIVGVEGSNSRTRKFLAPESYRNIRLPVRFTGAALDLTPEQVKPLKDIDPLLFQGCHPETGTFFWFSMLETPLVNGSAGTDNEHYRVQVMISWPMKTPEDEVKATDAERLAYMKQRATEFNPVLRDTVQRIPEGSEVIEIVLQDWPCPPWDNRNGRITLAGDAAHAMTMYRGEAANHGILDAYRLTKALEGAYHKGKGLGEAIDEYEAELRERTKVAVLLSRQACLDAHDWAGLNENSAVLKKRAIAGV